MTEESKKLLEEAISKYDRFYGDAWASRWKTAIEPFINLYTNVFSNMRKKLNIGDGEIDWYDEEIIGSILEEEIEVVGGLYDKLRRYGGVRNMRKHLFQMIYDNDFDDESALILIHICDKHKGEKLFDNFYKFLSKEYGVGNLIEKSVTGYYDNISDAESALKAAMARLGYTEATDYAELVVCD